MALVAFDFDGTLSSDEMIVLLAERAGCREEVAAVTDRAMRGELDYAESLRERVALFSDLSERDATVAYEGVALREGAAELIDALSDAGSTTAILTGGFEAGVRRTLERTGVSVDEIVANRLAVEDGHLTGDVEGPLVEETKDGALSSLASERGIDLAETVAVGDGANDVPMLDIAGTAVGFRPKPAVRSHCDATVDTMGELRTLLESLGAV